MQKLPAIDTTFIVLRLLKPKYFNNYTYASHFQYVWDFVLSTFFVL